MMIKDAHLKLRLLELCHMVFKKEKPRRRFTRALAGKRLQLGGSGAGRVPACGDRFLFKWVFHCRWLYPSVGQGFSGGNRQLLCSGVCVGFFLKKEFGAVPVDG